MTTPEHIFMLNDAHDLLKKIQNSYQTLLRAEHIPRSLMNDIRHFLNNIESSLDYVAFEIFTKYCLQHVSDIEKIESAKRAVSFPLHRENDFDRRIDKVFLHLRLEKPEIIEIFRKYQPFNNASDHWLPIFNKLVNNNKHRELEKQRISPTTTIHSMIDANGSTFKNVIFSNNGSDMNISGKRIDFRNYQHQPHLLNLDATVMVDFVFQSLQLSVLPTLISIYDGAHFLVTELEDILKS